ncbi:AIR synthase family protein [candidate division KSB1 bacterium]|nr:AIR synthase family protein [candidate division KSB1 bacterium]
MMAAQKFLATGKLPMDLLGDLIARYTHQDPSVIIGSGIGVDAAVLTLGENLLVAKSDPITFVAEDIGYYAVQINANDIACLGGQPRWFLVTLLLPENKTTPENVEMIFQQISDACKKAGIALCGGHTEITTGIDRPLVVGQMLGTVSREDLIYPSGIQAGDDIILTKGIAIEGASIIAREKSQEICEFFSTELVEQCKQLIYDPGISIVQDAQIARQVAPIHALHDPTEGGLSMGLYELSRASNMKLWIEFEKIPIIPESKLLCEVYGLDILGTIASGALLIAVSSPYSQEVVEKLGKSGISAAVIGKAISKGIGVKLKLEGEEMEMPIFPRDEIIKIL